MKLMELTFWWKDKQPGEVIEVRDEEVPSWRGFAKLLPDSAQPTAPVRSGVEKAPPGGEPTGDQPRPAAKAKAAAPPAKD